MPSAQAPTSDARPRRLDSAGRDELPGISELLAAAVAGIGGAERPGQVRMAEAVGRAMETGQHLAVQAGTGTGKSLAYLVPAIRHALEQDATVVVSTATIALQRQLIDRDLPRLATALSDELGREPVFAILKGRRNYLCLLRAKGDAPADPEDTLFDPGQTSAIGRQVKRLHEWAADTQTGDRDELVPGVDDRAWRQVSVSAQECIGVQRCPFGSRCYAERARDLAGHADVVVTNHALLAIDAIESFDVLPEHDVVVIDEAHELVDRVTSVASAELSAVGIEAAARRCGKLVDEKLTGALRDAGAGLERAVTDIPAGRLDFLAQELGVALASVRDAAGGCAAQLRSTASGGDQDVDRVSAAKAAAASLDELSGAAAEMLKAFGSDIASPAGRGVAGPAAGRLLAPGVAPGGAAPGRRSARGPAVRAAHGGADLGHAGPGRVLRAAGPAVGPAADQRDGRRPGEQESRAEQRRGRGGRAAPAGLDRAGRRLAVRPPAQRDPVHGAAPAPARPRRAARGLPHRAARADPRGRRPDPGPVLVHARGPAG